MDLFDVIRSCIRRWYVVVPLLLIAAWVAHNFYTSIKPVYYSSAVVTIAPPNSRLDQSELGVPVPRNGLLDVGGASLLANLAVFGLREPSVLEQVVAGGGQANYTVRMFPVDSGSPELPLIMVEATESDPATATRTVQLVADQADRVLRTLQQQAGVADDQMVRALPVSPPGQAAAGTPSRTRSTVAILVAGTGLAIVVGLVTDLLMTRFKVRPKKRKGLQDEVRTDDQADQGAGSTTGTGPGDDSLQNKHAAVIDTQ